MKQSFFVILCAVLMFIVITPFTAMAEDSDTRFYTNVKAGVYIPSDREKHAEFDTGFSGGFAAGFNIFPSLAVEGSVGYFNTQIAYRDSKALVGKIKGNFDVSVIPVTLSAKWVNHFKRSNIYVGGGLGAYYEMLDGEVETDFQGSFKFDDQDTVLGFHMLVGFLYNLSQNIYLGLEWSPLLLDEAKFKSNNSDKKATLEEVDLDGELLSAVFGIRF